MKKAVLFVSAGRTDLKLLSAEQDRDCAIEIDNYHTRIFHQWLLDYPDRYIVEHRLDEDLSFYQKPVKNAEAEVKVIDDGELKVSFKPKDETASGPIDLLVDEQDRLIIVPAKLGRVIAELQQLQLAGDFEIVAAVVFNTRRDDRCKFARNEPFACGPVLARWLAGCFDLTCAEAGQPGLGQATWVDLLQGNEDQELKNGAINPVAINRLAAVLNRLSGDPDLHAVLCGIGGLPRFKTLIRDSAFFYFDQRCLLAEDTESQQDLGHRVSIQPVDSGYLTPEQSFALRANVTKLIDSGDFLGAEAAVRHVQDPEHAAWVTPVRIVADWFRGLKPDCSRIEDEALRDLLTQLTESRLRCLLPALRTEGALQGERYIEAINSTASFVDAAKWDGIEQCLKQWGRVKRLDEFDRIVEFADRPIIPKFVLESQTTSGKEKAALTKENGNNDRYKIDTMHPCESVWFKAIAHGALSGLNNLINKPGDQKGRTPYHYRNINTHGVLSPDDLEKAIEAFIKARLWKARRATDARHSLYFLSNSQVIDVIKKFREIRANDVYRDLVSGLIKPMQQYRWPQA